MRIPEGIARYFELGEDAWREWRGFGGGVYPPPGFLPLPLLDVGNGDLYGLYWPIGREDAPPLACITLHDSWLLLPIATSIENCLRLEYAARRADGEEDANDEDDEGWADEVRETAELLGVALLDTCPPAGDAEYWGVAYAADLLPLDPGSPHLLLLDGRERNAAGDVTGAEASLRAALCLLPEYTDALYWLSQVLQRQGRAAEANAALLDALGSPLAFGSADVRRRALNQIKRAPDDALPEERTGDPLWQARHRLTLATGVKTNDDFPLYEEAVEACHARDEGIRAVRLRVLVGELFSAETVSFQARYGWSKEGWREQLRSDLARAGLAARLAAV